MNAIVEGTGTLSPLDLGVSRSKGLVIAFWMTTALFCLQIGFTAYAQLRLPQVAEAFRHLASPTISGRSSPGPSCSAWCCCWRRFRRG